MKTVLLYSGGTDSWLISQIAKPDIKLFFDIGTRSTEGEIRRLSKDVIIDKTLSGLGTLEKDDGSFILPLRNLYFIARAAEYGEHIILGTVGSDAHNDKTQEFANKVQDLLNYYYGPSEDGLSEIKDIMVDFSYKKYTKAQLLKMYIDQGGTVEEYINKTFSCYTPIKYTDENGNKCYKECCNCKPCMNKQLSITQNHLKTPLGRDSKFINVLENKLKEIDSGKKHRYLDRSVFQEALDRAYADKQALENKGE